MVVFLKRTASACTARPLSLAAFTLAMSARSNYTSAVAGKQTTAPGSIKASRGPPAVPKPSASILLVSPTNQVLLLHRVQNSSAFPSAHVFPGGNLSSYHETVPDAEAPERHTDGPAYRLAAIRETFEESGILLARRKGAPVGSQLLEVPENIKEEGRRSVHNDKIRFDEWLTRQGGEPDIESLLPFTRWITPANVPKRFTTQMYVYFLPLDSDAVSHDDSKVVYTPKHDGGLEHTAAAFDDCGDWIKRGCSGEIIIYPPQVYLIGHLAKFFTGATDYAAQRDALRQFLSSVPTGPSSHHSNQVQWAEKCISPLGRGVHSASGRQILSLESSGPELKNTGRCGDYDRVVLVKGTKAGPTNVDVVWRTDIQSEIKSEAGAVKAKL